MITEIYTDAGYTMGNSYGHIAYKIGDEKVKIKTIIIPHIPHLKQYTNLLELTAVLEAMKSTIADKILILTDSQCIYWWVKRKKNNLGKFSEFHQKVKEEIDARKKSFQWFNIEWISRDHNLAGIALEENNNKKT